MTTLKVHCKDANYRKVDKLALGPYSNELSDMIITEGPLIKTSRVVPLSLVETSTPEDEGILERGTQVVDLNNQKPGMLDPIQFSAKIN